MIQRQSGRQLHVPMDDSFVLPLPRRSLRIRWSRLLVAAFVLYLAVMTGWGAIVTMQLAAKEAALAAQVRSEEASNLQLEQQIRAYSGSQGREAAIQSQFGLVPAGQIPVKVQSAP